MWLGRSDRPLADVADGTIIGDYRVVSYLASGQWGSVYAARRLTPRPGAPDDVALKLLPAATLTPAQRATFAEILDREKRFGRDARHAHLIRVFEALTCPDGSVALVMELARTDLRRLLESNPGKPPADGAILLRQVWHALTYMHAKGWVHGDLKPANVLIADDGWARVGDFGLAAELDGTHGYTPGLGTQDYLPPEWWDQGLDSRGVITRPATDVWAFGVLAHEVLTGGMHPFPGATPAARAGAIREYAADPGRLRLATTIPEPWPAIIRDCLRASYAERLAATRDLAARMAGATPAGSTPPRHRVASAVAASMAVLLLSASAAPGEVKPAVPVKKRPRVSFGPAARCRPSTAR
ncbi:serine/threonine-protein kinase [Paractinoplanes durhamensis]|uniref:serine/threonine-protein kinase n=1 Tax=Paractinoplanes durhamensis TaxID=113563 RepID=UPI0036459F80